MSTTRIVLAMHGAPSIDFPGDELAEFFGLHMRLEHGAPGGEQRTHLEARYAELEEKVRTWPRTPQNDPFHAASLELAGHLEEATGSRVVVGFNEFCAPTLGEALAQATGEAQRVVVVTPMMTRGGEHSERDIPAAVARARARHPEVEFVYAWPFDSADVAGFLAEQIERLLGARGGRMASKGHRPDRKIRPGDQRGADNGALSPVAAHQRAQSCPAHRDLLLRAA